MYMELRVGIVYFNSLVNVLAALTRVNKPETVFIVLVLTVCSSREHYVSGQVQRLDQPLIGSTVG